MMTQDKESFPFDFGFFRIEERLSTGHLAEVLKGYRRDCLGHFSKPFVIKRFNKAWTRVPAFARALIQNTNLASELLHGNIAQVFDLGVVTEQYYVGTEYVHGCDVKRFCDAAREYKSPFPAQQAALIGSEVAAALAYAHRREQPMIHGHLTPTNIRVTPDGEVRITDFAVASTALRLPEGLYKPKDEDFRYAAPEVAMGQEAVAASDVYSLGLILYELLAAIHPFGFAPDAPLRQTASQGIPRPITEVASVPPAMAAVMESITHPNPAQRQLDAAQVHRDLCAYLDSVGHPRIDPILPQIVVDLLARDAEAQAARQTGDAAQAEAAQVTDVDESTGRPRRDTLYPTPDSGTHSVLAADDSRTIRRAYKISLQDADVTLVLAESGKQALDLTRQKLPELVILDHTMPGGPNGYQILAELKADPRLKHIPVVMCSSEHAPFDAERGAQAVAQLKKPFETQQVLDLVKEHLP